LTFSLDKSSFGSSFGFVDSVCFAFSFCCFVFHLFYSYFHRNNIHFS